MKYSVSVTIEGKDQTQEFETKDEVKETIQMLNSAKARGATPVYTITDLDTGNVMDAHEFGLPKPKKFTSKLANAVDRVNESEGDRASFEWLLELVAVKRYDAWDIQLALDEVFGGDSIEVGTQDKAVYDVSDEDKKKDKIKIIDNNITVDADDVEDLFEAVNKIDADDAIDKDDFMSAINQKYKKKVEVDK